MLHRTLRATALSLAIAATAATAHANEHGLDAANFDPAAGACRDFFQYADGGWLKSNPIPPAYSRWSLDDEINERNFGILKKVLETAAAQNAATNPAATNPAATNPAAGHLGAPGEASQKIGDFYAAAMDEAAIEKKGITPLKADLAAIAKLESPTDIAALVRDWQRQGNQVLFDLEAQPDLKDSNKDIAYAGQGGLGLPDRDYYMRDDAKSRELRTKYQAHVARVLGLLGDTDAKAESAWVLALETRLAKASLDRVALREPANSYHIVTLADADAKTPHFPWSGFFHNVGRDDVRSFSLAQPDFFVAADQALASEPLVHWQAYLRWRLIDAQAPYLGKAFVDADFDFRGRTLRGAKEIKPRWKRAIVSADGALGELLGQAYVAQAFPPEAKQHALELVNNLKIALRERIGRLDWMSAETKKSAYAKLDTLVAKIGYPDKWRDYSKLQISRSSYIENMRAAAAFEAQRQFAKIDRPVDRSEWDMTPQTVNAYNNPMGNEIVFPAAQLLPPYFEASADDAINYGGIGSVIGHEMLHSFDDQGSKFDAHGNLVDWWTQHDRSEFEARTAKLVEQFNAYVPVDDLHIDGKLTLGENIADLGGLLVAYDAFKLATKGRDAAKIEGLTPDQRFFLSYAQTWRTAQRPEQLRLQVQSNEHAPAKFRTNGPLSDTPAFARAFDCKAGDPMLQPPANFVDIW
jgi:putative endopeptidase